MTRPCLQLSHHRRTRTQLFQGCVRPRGTPSSVLTPLAMPEGCSPAHPRPASAPASGPRSADARRTGRVYQRSKRDAPKHTMSGARPDFENLRNAVLSLGCLFPLLGYRRSWGWLLGITPILSNSAASCCESLQTSTTSAKDRSGHSTGNAANPTAIARAQARRVMARTGC